MHLGLVNVETQHRTVLPMHQCATSPKLGLNGASPGSADPEGRPPLGELLWASTFAMSLWAFSLAFQRLVFYPIRSYDESVASVLPGPACAARDGIGPGFGPPLLGFMLDICIHVWNPDTLVSGPTFIRLILVLLLV